MRKQERLHSERNVLRPDFKESVDAESFEKKTVKFVYRPSLEYRNKQSYFSERNIRIICVYLSATH